MWPGVLEHYRRFLPVGERTPVVTLQEGNTPLLEAPRLREAARGGLRAHPQREGFHPTGTPPAAAAACAARGGLRAFVVVPKGAVALGKLSQALIHGATVIMVDGSFDQAFALVRGS